MKYRCRLRRSPKRTGAVLPPRFSTPRYNPMLNPAFASISGENLLRQKLSRLGPAQLALLMRKLDKDANRSRIAPIPHTPHVGEAALSSAQEGLWFLDQLEPGNIAYNMPYAVRVEGTLNISVVQRAMDEIVARHEVLRTSFQTREGQPVQVIDAVVEVTL